MTTTPKTAKEINNRMKEIGAELAKYPVVPHPRQRELSAELNYLRSIYTGILEAEGVDHEP
jgi:hypothetical protein